MSLAQTLLKLTMPGVPDIYWGNELIELRLVDPDNRGPIDFGMRRTMIETAAGIGAAEAMAGEATGMAKLYVTMRALDLRRRRPEVFAGPGGYLPLPVRGTPPGRAVAFTRGTPPMVVTVVPRLIAGIGGVPAEVAVELPTGRWHDELSGDEVDGGVQTLGTLLGAMPVALLSRLS